VSTRVGVAIIFVIGIVIVVEDDSMLAIKMSENIATLSKQF
jgi:hypothetical protein